MILNGKRVDLGQLQTELATAGITANGLGTSGDDLHTYDSKGVPIDLPAGATAVIAAHVPSLQVVGYAGSFEISTRARTTDATPLAIYRATIPRTTGYCAKLNLLAVDAGNGALRSIEASIVTKRLGGGAIIVPNAAAAPATVLADHRDGTASTWTITPSVAGNDFVLTVVGAAGRTVDWFCRLTVDSFTPGGA